MASITLNLSKRKNKENGRAELLIRLVQGSRLNVRVKSGIWIDPNNFEYDIDVQRTTKAGVKLPARKQTSTEEAAAANGYFLKSTGAMVIKNRIAGPEKTYHEEAAEKIHQLVQDLNAKVIGMPVETITKSWLEKQVYEFHHPRTVAPNKKKNSFFNIFDAYLTKSKVSDVRKKNIRVLEGILQRFEVYRKTPLQLDTFTADVITEFVAFAKNEHTFFHKVNNKLCPLARYQYIYSKHPVSRPPEERGENYVLDLLGKLRTFFLWAAKEGYTTNKPFDNYRIAECQYGPVICLTREERDALFAYDFSDDPKLAKQRDIFIFQCLIGCRIDDYYCLSRKSNLIYDDEYPDGAIFYTPHKTKHDRIDGVIVPLSAKAKEILNRYPEDVCGGSFLPFIPKQKYNTAIKKMLKRAGINRLVQWLNPKTRTFEQRPIYEVAASHMARRVFTNLVYQANDYNQDLTCVLTGHKPGSRAFKRYRKIDADKKKSMINAID